VVSGDLIQVYITTNGVNGIGSPANGIISIQITS